MAGMAAVSAGLGHECHVPKRLSVLCQQQCHTPVVEASHLSFVLEVSGACNGPLTDLQGPQSGRRVLLALRARHGHGCRGGNNHY